MSILDAALIVAVPATAFMGGLPLFARLGRVRIVERRLANNASPDQRTALWKRWGYDGADVQAFLSALHGDSSAWPALRRTLEWDLLFPVLYGTGGAIAAWMAARAGVPHWGPAALTAATLTTVAADWTENAQLLKHVREFRERNSNPPSAAIASTATRVKLAMLGVVAVAILANAALALH